MSRTKKIAVFSATLVAAVALFILYPKALHVPSDYIQEDKENLVFDSATAELYVSMNRKFEASASIDVRARLTLKNAYKYDLCFPEWSLLHRFSTEENFKARSGREEIHLSITQPVAEPIHVEKFYRVKAGDKISINTRLPSLVSLPAHMAQRGESNWDLEHIEIWADIFAPFCQSLPENSLVPDPASDMWLYKPEKHRDNFYYYNGRVRPDNFKTWIKKSEFKYGGVIFVSNALPIDLEPLREQVRDHGLK